MQSVSSTVLQLFIYAIFQLHNNISTYIQYFNCITILRIILFLGQGPLAQFLLIQYFNCRQFIYNVIWFLSGQGPPAHLRVEGPVSVGAEGEAASGGGAEERLGGEGTHH